MAIYPKKKIRMVEGGLKFDLSKLGNENGGLDSTVAGALAMGSNALFGQQVQTDNRGFQRTRSLGNFAGRNAAQFAAAGSQFGPVGAGIGAGIGAITGLIQGKKMQNQVNRQNSMLRESNQRNLRKQGNATFQNNLSSVSNSLYRNGGNIYPAGRRMFNDGGVILGGKSHEEMGNLIVDEQGNPVAETESEELVLSYEQTEAINKMIEMVEQNPNDLRFAELGKFFANNILPSIQDNSGKFKLNKADTGTIF